VNLLVEASIVYLAAATATATSLQSMWMILFMVWKRFRVYIFFVCVCVYSLVCFITKESQTIIGVRIYI
jgi:hypothetical protein